MVNILTNLIPYQLSETSAAVPACQLMRQRHRNSNELELGHKFTTFSPIRDDQI